MPPKTIFKLTISYKSYCLITWETIKILKIILIEKSTILTSFTTLLVLLCIFFLGGDAIRSFSFAMILGVVVGTLSSIESHLKMHNYEGFFK